MLAYLFGPSEPAAPPPPPKRPAASSPSMFFGSKKTKTFETGAELGALRCGKNDDLVAAYDELLETFDAEQARFAEGVKELEEQHEGTMAELARSRDSAAERLAAKQATFDESLKELEVKLTALLRRRVEATYAAKTEEATSVLTTLDEEVRKKDLDLEGLKTTYGELTTRLEQQRSDHARHVATAARDALAQQQQVADQKLGATKASFEKELDELKLQLEALRDAGRGTQADRDRELAELRAAFKAALDALEAELRAKLEAFHYARTEPKGVDKAKVDLDKERDKGKAEREAAARRLKDLEAALEAARFKLDQARQHHAEVDANQAERLQARTGRFKADLKDEGAVEATHRGEVAARAAAAREREEKLASDKLAEFKKRQLARKADGDAELAMLKAELKRAEQEAAAAEAARKQAVDARRNAYKHEEAMAHNMIKQIKEERDEAALEAGPGDQGSSAAFADAGDLDTRLLTLRKDASALRAAVAELERTLTAEGDAHAARIKAMANAIKRKNSELTQTRATKTAPPSKAHDLASFDAGTLAEWNEIVAAGRAFAKSWFPGSVSATSERAPAPNALLSRSTVVEQELGAVEEELARATGGRRNLLEERHGDLEREAAILMRLNKAKGYDAGLGAQPKKVQAPSRLDQMRKNKEIEAATARDVEAMAALPAKHLNFYWDDPATLAAALGETSYVDLAYPPREGMVYGPADRKAHKLLYKRGPAIYADPAVFLRDPSPADIRQGKLGDCWLMCALAACAEFPAVVKKLFPDGMTEPQPSGLYRVRLCQGGLWRTVTIDDFFPCDQDGAPIFSRANGAELWVLLLEKAMAKLAGNYMRLRGGLAFEGLADLTGLPTFRFKFKHELVKGMVSSGELFEQLVFADKNRCLACASTPGEDRFTEGRGDFAKPADGLIPGHAYSLLAAREVGGHRLVRLRNPWGKFEWAGAWSDGDARWTKAFKAKVAKAVGMRVEDVVREGDGCFWMAYEDFVKHFASFSLSLARSVAGAPWQEARARGQLTVDDPAELYSMHLPHDAHVVVGVHQQDERLLGQPEDYMHLGFTVVRRGLGDSTGTFRYQAGCCPSNERQQFAPNVGLSGGRAKWPAGEYTICAYTTSAGVRKAKRHYRSSWPETYDKVLMRGVTREIFSRFNHTLDGILSVGEGGEAAELLAALGLNKISDITKLMAHARRRDGLAEAEVGDWLASHADWPDMLKTLGYEPGKTPRDPPVCVASRPIAVTVHADVPVSLVKVADDPDVIEEASELPILHDGACVPYDDLEVYSLQAHGGASMLVKNTGSGPTKVTMDMSKSRNCKSHTGSLVASLVVPPGESKIMHHVCPAGRGAWGYTYELSWAAM